MQVPPSSIRQICCYNPYIFYLSFPWPFFNKHEVFMIFTHREQNCPYKKRMYVFFGLIINNPNSIVNNFTTKANSIQKELTLFEFKNCLLWKATAIAIYLSFTQWRQRMWWYCQQDFDYDTSIFCFISIYIKVIRPWSSALFINLQKSAL